MKKFRNAMVAICLMICALALTACGGGQLSTEAGVSKKGFVAASKSDYTEFQTAGEVDTSDLTSMKVTTSMKLSVNDKVTNEMAITAIVTVAEDGTPDGIALKMTMKTEGTDVAMEAYYTEGYSYFKAVKGKETKKYKVATPATDLGTSEISSFLEDIDLEELVNTFLTDLESVDNVNAEGITFEKAFKGDNKRFHVGINDEKTNSSSDVYVEFQGTKLVGIEATATGANKYLGGTLYTKSAVNKFNGKIKFPSFKGYEEVTEDTLNEVMKGFINA